MRYVVARLKQVNREMAYRIYLTDSLHLYAQNKYLPERWCDLINNKVERDDRTADEVISDLKQKLKHIGGEDNGCI